MLNDFQTISKLHPAIFVMFKLPSNYLHAASKLPPNYFHTTSELSPYYLHTISKPDGSCRRPIKDIEELKLSLAPELSELSDSRIQDLRVKSACEHVCVPVLTGRDQGGPGTSKIFRNPPPFH